MITGSRYILRLDALLGSPCKWLARLGLASAIMSGTPNSGWARPLVVPGVEDTLALDLAVAVGTTVMQTRIHYVGEIWMAVDNVGRYGGYEASGRDRKVSVRDLEALRINYIPSLEFPAGTRNEYLFFAGLWFGGIVGTDTLVSQSVNNLGPQDEITSFDTITEASSSRGSPYYDGGTKGAASPCSTLVYRNAYAEQQYYARYTDTVIGNDLDEFESRRHKPLGLEISQTSFAWSDRVARDFVIVQLWVRNISDHPISGFALGVFTAASVSGRQSHGAWGDDISGLLVSAPNVSCPEFKDPLNVAWAADNDGDSKGGRFSVGTPHGVVGLRILEAPPVEGMSFNWWTFHPDWGPARNGSGDPIGNPSGDRQRYRMMTNHAIDYGQCFAGLDHSNDGWQTIKPAVGCDVASGSYTRELLSVGPVLQDLIPGDSIRLAFAFLAGDDFHRNSNQQFNCLNPKEFLDQKDFSSLAFAAQWAGWVYDRPNFDTDCDGYSGETHYCLPEEIVWKNPLTGENEIRTIYHDTVSYVGDLGPQPSSVSYGGAPDLTGPQPPPCPDVASGDLSFETRPGEIILRWDGRNVETSKDPLLGNRDFEGYRVFIGPRDTPESYSLVANWDLEDYRRLFYDAYYDPAGQPHVSWLTNDSTYTIEQIRRMTGDSTFEAYKFNTPSYDRCYVDTILNTGGAPVERRSYFEPVGPNSANVIRQEGREWINPIQRVRVDTTVAGGDTVVYGEYELALTNLNPSLGQYVSITAFDGGDPSIKLDPTETRPGTCNVFAIPIYSAENVARQNLKVSVYPNPYRLTFTGEDGRLTTYYQRGYEAPEKGADPEKFIEQDRRIHFINLPDTATITIYTLDGDLVRTIEHPDKNLSSYSSKASWDLVSRNAQAVVSGIYIYRVTSKLGSQVGKIVIIK